MRIGVLGNEGSWYYRDLARAAAEQGHGIDRLDFSRMTARVNADGGESTAGQASSGTRRLSHINVSHDLKCLAEKYEAVIVRTMPPGSLEQVVYRMDALSVLESAGVRVINPPKAIECAVDKFLTTHRLAAAGLQVPATVVCEDADSAMEAFSQLGGDVVVKPVFGSEGRGIVRASDPDLAWRTFRTLERLNAVLYLQQFIDHSGWDVRVMVLNGTILGGMKRISGQDFRTNVSRQASIEPHQPTDQEQSWALVAANAVGAWFAGVDLLYNRAGLGYVIEVNAVPGWRAFARATGKDIAGELIARIALAHESQ